MVLPEVPGPLAVVGEASQPSPRPLITMLVLGVGEAPCKVGDADSQAASWFQNAMKFAHHHKGFFEVLKNLG